MSIAQGSLENNRDGPDVWPQVLDVLQGQMTKGTFVSVFSGSQADLSGETLTIYPGSNQAHQWLKHRWSERIAETAETVAGRRLTIEIAPPPERPRYGPLVDLLDPEPEPEPGQADAELEGAYYDRRNAIIQPRYIEQHTQYFRKKWRPLLGPLLSELVRELRQRCHFKTGRNTFKTTYKSLAQALGVSERTIKRALERDADGNFKHEYLGYFIKELQTLHHSDGKSIRNLGTRFVVYLDEPLTPNDEAKFREGQDGT